MTSCEDNTGGSDQYPVYPVQGSPDRTSGAHYSGSQAGSPNMGREAANIDREPGKSSPSAAPVLEYLQPLPAPGMVHGYDGPIQEGEYVSGLRGVSPQADFPLNMTYPLQARRLSSGGQLQRPEHLEGHPDATRVPGLSPVGYGDCAGMQPYGLPPPQPTAQTVPQQNKASVYLCNRQLWLRFHQHTTEMIITKQGR